MSNLRIGTHMRGGARVSESFGHALESGRTAMQVFAGRKLGYDAGVTPKVRAPEGVHTVIHCSYFPQLTHQPGTEKQTLSVNGILSQMRWAHALGATDVVIHPGSPKHSGDDRVTAIEWAIESLSMINDRLDVPVSLSLESMASRKSIGGNLTELSSMIDLANSEGMPWVKMCIDTAHAFGAGVTVDEMLDLLVRVPHQLSVVHLNAPNPTVQFGSNMDRHSVMMRDMNDVAWLWMEEVASLLLQPEFADIPYIMEGSPSFREDANAVERWRT